MTRRHGVLRRILITLSVLAVLCCGGGTAALTWLWTGASISTVGEGSFGNRLAIPPLAPSTLDAEGRRVFDLRAQAGTHDFGAGAAPTWGFNGAHLGPTLRAARGEKVLVNVTNTLPEQTSVHWHGMHLPAAMDGGPHQPVPAGGTWSPTWTVNQPAATLWYHPHPHGATAAHVYRGLAGMFILDDPATSVAALPHEYGVDDIPLIVQDKRLDGDGRPDEANSDLTGAGILGGTIAVNGTVDPHLDVTTERVRLRLLNASNLRSYDFGLSDDRRFTLVGTDGGLLAAPHDTTRIMLSPGERAEIVVTVRPGERVILRSTPPRLGLGSLADRFNGGADSFDILQLRAAARLAPGPRMPEKLVDVPRLDPASAAQRRTFRLSGNSINGRRMELDRVDAAVLKDSVEVWKVSSSDGEPHSFHVHDVQFQVSSMDGAPPPPHLAGWKDTVHLTPNVRFEIIARFADHADPTTPYMFHCHTLAHEDRGMMGQFVIVEKGQVPAVRHSGHN